MAPNLSMIGIHASELRWIRTLVQLLRHPDPSVPELTRQALMYMTDAAARTSIPTSLDHPRQIPQAMDFAG
jgi:hypothetical protein